ncbi:hypothetical protein Rs2_32825 [Raphanus sativus]|nr:hypothetical protein Rs2_32825 [Raphanus sativus]
MGRVSTSETSSSSEAVGRRRDRNPRSHRNCKSPPSSSRGVDVVLDRNTPTGFTGRNTTTTRFHLQRLYWRYRNRGLSTSARTSAKRQSLEHILEERKPATTIREETARPQKQSRTTTRENGAWPEARENDPYKTNRFRAKKTEKIKRKQSFAGPAVARRAKPAGRSRELAKVKLQIIDISSCFPPHNPRKNN